MVPFLLLAAKEKAPFLVHHKQILDPSYFVNFQPETYKYRDALLLRFLDKIIRLVNYSLSFLNPKKLLWFEISLFLWSVAVWKIGKILKAQSYQNWFINNMAVGNSTFLIQPIYLEETCILWLIQFLNIVHAFCHVLVTTLGTVKSIIEFYAIFEHGQKYWTLQKHLLNKQMN